MTAIEPLLDTEQVCDWLNIPERTFYDWRRRGIGPRAYKVGKHLRFKRADVEIWLAGRTDTGTGGDAA